MLPQSFTLAELVAGMAEDRCKGCPPDRVCAWACKHGMGVIDNAIAAALNLSLDEPLEDIAPVQQALCECYL